MAQSDMPFAEPLAQFLDQTCVSWLQRVFLAIVALNILLWPIAPLLLDGDATKTSTLIDGLWQVGLLSTLLYVIVTALKNYKFRTLRFALVLGGCIVLGGLFGYTTGRLGGLNHSFFYGGYGLSMVTVWALYPLPKRIALVSFINVSFLLGHFLPFPYHALNPELASSIAVLLIISTGMIACGHVIYALTRDNWLLKQRV